MKENLKNPMLFHVELPVLLACANTMKKMVDEYQTTRWIPWQSKQTIPRSWLSARETQGAVFALDEQRKSVPYWERPSIRRGDFPVTDALIDDFMKVLIQEVLDVAAFIDARGSKTVSPSGGGTAAASTGAATSVAGAVTTASPRKRSYSSLNKDVTATNLTTKVAEGARAAPFPSPRPRPASTDGGRSFAPMRSTAFMKGLSQSQMSTMMKWMEENDYNRAPSWSAIDHLVESTGAKPSQVVDFLAQVEFRASKYNNVEDSVPELTEEPALEDAWNGFVAGDEVTEFPAAKPQDGPEVGSNGEVGFDVDIDSLDGIHPMDLMIMELGMELEESRSWGSIQDELSVPCGIATDKTDALVDGFDLDLDFGLMSTDANESLHRPSKRARSDSLDSLFALLDSPID